MIAWVASWGTGSSIHDTEEQAMEAAARGQRMAEIKAALDRARGRIPSAPAVGVHYRVVLEPAVRGGDYWARAREGEAA